MKILSLLSVLSLFISLPSFANEIDVVGTGTGTSYEEAENDAIRYAARKCISMGGKAKFNYWLPYDCDYQKGRKGIVGDCSITCLVPDDFEDPSVWYIKR